MFHQSLKDAFAEVGFNAESPVEKRFLVRTSECSYCDETDHYYLAFHEDGHVTVEYVGCGGYQGMRAECHGQFVSREEAIQTLHDRLSNLRDTLRQLKEEIIGFETFLGVSPDTCSDGD